MQLAKEIMMYTVEIHQHNVKIRTKSNSYRQKLQSYIHRRLTEYAYTGKKVFVPELNRMSFPIKAVYCDLTMSHATVHRLAYNDLKKELVNTYGCLFEETVVASHDVPTICQDMLATAIPRKHQIPAIEFVDKDAEYNAKLYALLPGQGKSISTLFSLRNAKVPAVGFMRPSFIGVWVKSIKEFTTATEDEYLIIKGKAQLEKWIDTLGDHPPHRYVIISNKTYDRWVKRIALKEMAGIAKPKIIPENIMEHARAGICFVDETHLDFHFNYMHMLRTNVPKFIGLSGTFVHEDPFTIKRQGDMYPAITHQYDSLTVKPYIHIVNYCYSTPAGVKPVISHRGNKMYNHGAYEKWISASQHRKQAYFDMVVEIIDHDYIRHRITNSKTLVFFASVDMVNSFNAYLGKVRPELISIVFVAANEYEEILTPDIINSTLLKAGTGVDVPGLILVINTVSVRSIQSNRQSIGRLRDIEEEIGIEMRYVQIYNKMILQHIQYANARDRQWVRIAKSSVKFDRINSI